MVPDWGPRLGACGGPSAAPLRGLASGVGYSLTEDRGGPGIPQSRPPIPLPMSVTLSPRTQWGHGVAAVETTFWARVSRPTSSPQWGHGVAAVETEHVGSALDREEVAAMGPRVAAVEPSSRWCRGSRRWSTNWSLRRKRRPSCGPAGARSALASPRPSRARSRAAYAVLGGPTRYSSSRRQSRGPRFDSTARS